MSQLSDQLLGHYTQTFKDRNVYYAARERSRSQRDILVCILDSFDKAKMVVPRWCWGRTPKKPIYEQIHRNSESI